MCRGRAGLAIVLCMLLVSLACDAEIQAILDAELEAHGLEPGEVGVVQALCTMIHGVSWMAAKKLGLPNKIDDCADRWFGTGGNRPGLQRAGANGVTANGLTVMERYSIDSTTKAGRLPKWKADLPTWHGDNSDMTASVGVILTEESFGNPAKTPKKFQARLFQVKPNGKRKKVGQRVGRIKNSSGAVSFADLGPPPDHYQIEIKMRGGKALPGTLFYMAGIAGADATARPVRARGAARSANAASASSVTSESLLILDAHTIVGKVKARSFPDWTAQLFPTNTSAGGAVRSVLAGLLVFDENYQPNNTAPKAVQARLFDVDRRGKRTRLGTKKVAVVDGVATAEFNGLEPPSNHFEVEIEPVGGRGSSGFLTLVAAEGPDGAAAATLPLLMAQRRAALAQAEDAMRR